MGSARSGIWAARRPVRQDRRHFNPERRVRHVLVQHLDDNNDDEEALRPSALPDGNHEFLAQCRQEAGGSEGRSCHLLLCSTQGPSREQQQQQRPAHTAARFGLWACRPQLAPSRSRRRRSCGFLSQRQQETAGQRKPRAEYPVTATSNDRVNWPPKIPRWTKGTCRRGRANFQLLVDGQAGSSLLLVVRFCFGLLQPRSLAPLGNADKKVQAAWRKGGWRERVGVVEASRGCGALPQLLVSGLHLLHLGHR